MTDTLTSTHNSTTPLLSLFNRLDSDTLVLTPNKRLSRFVTAQFDQFQAQKGLSAWVSAPCQSFSGWILTLWQHWLLEAQEPQPQRLNTEQERLIWHDIIQNDDQIELFNSEATAAKAMEAWHNLINWQQDPCQSSQQSPYGGWAQAFADWCLEHQFIDMASLQQRIVQLVTSGQIPLPKKLLWLAFDDINPLMQALITNLKAAGCQCEMIDTRIDGSHVQVTQATSIDEEISAAARWAAQIVEQQPQAQVGIVIPSLARDRTKVERLFNEVFEPQALLPDQPRHAPGFNVSAAEPLASAPMIAAALAALKLNFSKIAIEDISHCINSPFLGDMGELPARARCAQELSAHNLRCRLPQVIAGLHEEGAERFAESVQDLVKTISMRQTANRPSAWMAFFCEQLSCLGWPGSRPLDTFEYQQLNSWHEVLDIFAGLDYIKPRIELTEAIRILGQLAHQHLFQAQTRSSSVQLLGTLEAAGLHFDYLWVMGMDDRTWPPAPNPNPLIDLQLQRRLAMPRSSADKELALAKQLTQRFQRAAPEVIFSYALFDQDQSLSVSQLIEHLPKMPLEQIHKAEITTYDGLIFAERMLDTFSDACGPYVQEPSLIKGGTQILKDQASCPFKAFATHRLKAKASEPAQEGLSPAERGSLLHNVLSRLWHRLRNQATLLSLSPEQLSQQIDNSIRAEIKRLPKSEPLGERFTNLERERLKALILQWLELEKQRQPFEVAHNETKRSLTLNKLPIRIRYDRVDRLADGRLFIIDYKTGQLDIRQWAGDRPDEPQVPLYCIANESDVSGAAFGQIHVEQVAIKGLADDAEIAPGLLEPDQVRSLDLPDNWPDLIQHWRAQLTSLAKEFMAGQAEVKPKNPSACQYCSLHSLCRIKEYVQEPDDDEVPNETE